jgi:adenosylcobinamide-GDP ribazoletransferase
MKTFARLFFAAVQFLTRIPVPRYEFHQDDLPRSFVFFPLVGLLVAAGGLLLRFAFSRYMSNAVGVVLLLLYLVLVTGGLHEDALGDAADGLGGGWDKEQALTIMRDSRLGSYGAIAISLSLLSRFVFLSELPTASFAAYFAAGQMLSRWTALPLSFLLPPARKGSGQGNLVARKISWFSLIAGTVLAFGIAAFFLKGALLWVGPSALLVSASSGLYYRKRLGGITGDCLGATIQLAEIGVYLTGVVVHG